MGAAGPGLRCRSGGGAGPGRTAELRLTSLCPGGPWGCVVLRMVPGVVSCLGRPGFACM